MSARAIVPSGQKVLMTSGWPLPIPLVWSTSTALRKSSAIFGVSSTTFFSKRARALGVWSTSRSALSRRFCQLFALAYVQFSSLIHKAKYTYLTI